MSRQTKPKFEVPNTDPQHLFVWPTVKQDKYQKRLTVSPDSRIVYSAPGGWASAVYWAEPEIQAWKWDSTSNCWIETINFGVLGSRQTNVAFTGPTTAGITLWLCCQDPVPGNGDEEPDDSVIDELQIAPTSQNPANIPDCKSEFDRVGRSSGDKTIVIVRNQGQEEFEALRVARTRAVVEAWWISLTKLSVKVDELLGDSVCGDPKCPTVKMVLSDLQSELRLSQQVVAQGGSMGWYALVVSEVNAKLSCVP